MVDGVLTERLKDEKVNSDPQMAARAGSRSPGRNQGERRGARGRGETRTKSSSVVLWASQVQT